jgi:hypothetical protein
MNSCDLQMMLPPINEVSCCKDSIKFCTRWSFMDENCVTCDTLICTVVVRQYKNPPIVIWHPGAYATQIAKMGEPYNSWYLQKGTELPRNFSEQVDALYSRQTFTKEEQVTKEVFTENLKTAFSKIQALKTSTGDAIWSEISGNPINSQCVGGDFETGILYPSEWSAGYGFVFSSNNPSTGTYTLGTLPTSGINPPINTGTNCFVSATGNMADQATQTHHSIVSYGNDVTVGALLKTTTSPTNLNSLRIGNSCYEMGSEFISKKFVVSGNGIIKFTYALVMDGVHSTTSNPSFWVKVYDNSGTAISGVVYLDPTSILPKDNAVSPIGPDPFFQRTGSVNYRDWTCAKIDLSDPKYQGQTITVALITTDCSGGAHYGYAYIDNWCGNCEGASSGSVTIKPIQDSCIKTGTKVCVDYTLPKGATTGTGTITLNFYQNGSLLTYNLTSPMLTANGTHCFTIDPTRLPCNNGQQGYDVVATGNFTLGTATITVTSPDPVGTSGNVQGIKPGKNNDLVCCGTLSERCCDDFKKTVTTTVTVLGTAASGYTSVKFVPTFNAGPKPIKQVRISILNFETNSSNKECLTCESNTNSYGAMSVPQGITGGGKDAIEGMVYPSNPLTYYCPTCPPTWRNGRLTHEVIWGSNSGPGYNLMDGVGDQSTTFTVSVPKKSSLSCCDDTIKVCVKYSFTDIDCKTCDTIICYKVVNRQTTSIISQPSSMLNRSGNSKNADSPGRTEFPLFADIRKYSAKLEGDVSSHAFQYLKN